MSTFKEISEKVKKFEKSLITDFKTSERLSKNPFMIPELTQKLKSFYFNESYLEKTLRKMNLSLKIDEEFLRSQIVNLLVKTTIPKIQEQNLTKLYIKLKKVIEFELVEVFDFGNWFFSSEYCKYFNTQFILADQSTPIHTLKIEKILSNKIKNKSLEDAAINIKMILLDINNDCKKYSHSDINIFEDAKNTANFKIEVFNSSLTAFYNISMMVFNEITKSYSISSIIHGSDLKNRRLSFSQFLIKLLNNKNKVFYNNLSISNIRDTLKIDYTMCYESSVTNYFQNYSKLDCCQKWSAISQGSQFTRKLLKKFKTSFLYSLGTTWALTLNQDIFFGKIMEKAKKEIQATVKFEYKKILKEMKQTDHKIQKIIQKLIIDTITKGEIYDNYFPNPKNHQFGQINYNHDLKKLIMMSFIYSDLEEFTPEKYKDHNCYLGKICSEFGIHKSSNFLKAFALTKSLKDRKEHQEYIQQQILHIQAAFFQIKDICRESICKILFGMYLITLKAKNMMGRVISAKMDNKKMEFKELDYQYRRYLFKAIRTVFNGKFKTLNVNIILCMDKHFEIVRHNHNHELRVRFPLLQDYHIDYNRSIERFKKIEIQHLASILQKKYDYCIEESNYSLNPDAPNTFIDNFIGDMSFNMDGSINMRDSMIHRMAQNDGIYDDDGIHGMIMKYHSNDFRDMNANHASLESLRISKFHEKLKYLISKVKKFEIVELNNKKTRTRVKIICLSGFTSEDNDKKEDWKKIVKRYPHNEVLSINWEAENWKSIARGVATKVVGIIEPRLLKGFNFLMKGLKWGKNLLGLNSDDKKAKIIDYDVKEAIEYEKFSKIISKQDTGSSLTQQEKQFVQDYILQVPTNPSESNNIKPTERQNLMIQQPMNEELYNFQRIYKLIINNEFRQSDLVSFPFLTLKFQLNRKIIISNI